MAKSESCCSCIRKHVHPPAPDTELLEGFDLQGRWDAIGMFSCCSYESADPSLAICSCLPADCCKTCTWCPILFPQAVNAPCIPFGKIITIMNEEREKDQMCCKQCGLGKRGCASCLCLSPFIFFGGVPPTCPIQFSCIAAAFTTLQRVGIGAEYGLSENGWENLCIVFACYPCALWKHLVFLTEPSSHTMAKKKERKAGV